MRRETRRAGPFRQVEETHGRATHFALPGKLPRFDRQALRESSRWVRIAETPWANAQRTPKFIRNRISSAVQCFRSSAVNRSPPSRVPSGRTRGMACPLSRWACISMSVAQTCRPPTSTTGGISPGRCPLECSVVMRPRSTTMSRSADPSSSCWATSCGPARKQAGTRHRASVKLVPGSLVSEWRLNAPP